MTRKSIKKMMQHLRNKKGQGMIEYLFVLILIALAVITSLTPFGTAVANKFTEFAAIVNNTK